MSTDLIAAPDLRAIAFTRLVRVEWGKATDTRAARWIIGITLAATVLIMLAPLIAAHSIDQTFDQYLQFAAIPFSTLLPVAAILTLTTEWTQRTVLMTFTQEPRRVRVMSAKVVVAVILAVTAMAVAAASTAAALALAAGLGRDLANDLDLGNTVGFVAFVLANVLMGVAFGAVLHNTTAAVTLYFVLPIAFGILGAAIGRVGEWIDPGTAFGWMLDGHWGHGHGPRIAVAALVWVIIPLGAGLIRTVRREIQ